LDRCGGRSNVAVLYQLPIEDDAESGLGGHPLEAVHAVHVGVHETMRCGEDKVWSDEGSGALWSGAAGQRNDVPHAGVDPFVVDTGPMLERAQRVVGVEVLDVDALASAPREHADHDHDRSDRFSLNHRSTPCHDSTEPRWASIVPLRRTPRARSD